MIKNKYYTFINTKDSPAVLQITLELPDGSIVEVKKVIQPKQVSADLVEEFKNVYGKGVKVASVTSSEIKTAGGKVTVSEQTLLGHSNQSLGKDDILKKSILMDIETTGLKGGDIVHQIAVYDPSERKGYMFRPTPELITQDKVGGEEALSRRGAKG